MDPIEAPTADTRAMENILASDVAEKRAIDISVGKTPNAERNTPQYSNSRNHIINFDIRMSNILC